jgi:CheY-like chemotaxis protein
MHRILVAAAAPKGWAEFAKALTENGEVQLAWVESGAAALADAMRHPPVCVVIGEGLTDMDALELVRRLMSVNAMICTAVQSGLAAEEFHAASEGLGVLMQIPPRPGTQHAGALLSGLRRIGMLSAGRPGRRPTDS